MIPKFRAWDKNNAYMEYTDKNLTVVFAQDGIQVVDHTTFSSSCTNMEDYVLMHPTGLFDKNGTEIFEGDIVKDTDGYVGYIAFLKQEMGYVIVYKNYDKRLGHRYRLDDGHLEILGNIYQDKHLLGED